MKFNENQFQNQIEVLKYYYGDANPIYKQIEF